MSAEIVVEVRRALAEVEKNFQGVDWKNSLADIAREVRLVGSKFSEADKIQGFVLELNGADASTHRPSWPEAVFEQDVLNVKLSAGFLDKTEHIEFKFGHVEVVAAVDEAAPVEEPAVVSQPEALAE